MKTSLFTLLLCLSAGFAAAQTTFPGLKAILSDAEWKRAGLDRLTPDEIGVIDAALIRQQAGATATTPQLNPGMMQRFGLPLFDEGDWRTKPPLKARFVKWEGGNRFHLDNGQVWEGFDPITYDLAGKDLEIQARPHGQFALVIDGVSTTLRVMRLR